MDNNTSNRALGFLIWFRKYYNGESDKTYQQIANDYGQANYGALRMYLLELAENGYVEIINKSKRTQRFVVVESKFMELI